MKFYHVLIAVVIVLGGLLAYNYNCKNYVNILTYDAEDSRRYFCEQYVSKGWGETECIKSFSTKDTIRMLILDIGSLKDSIKDLREEKTVLEEYLNITCIGDETIWESTEYGTVRVNSIEAHCEKKKK